MQNDCKFRRILLTDSMLRLLAIPVYFHKHISYKWHNGRPFSPYIQISLVLTVCSACFILPGILLFPIWGDLLNRAGQGHPGLVFASLLLPLLLYALSGVLGLFLLLPGVLYKKIYVSSMAWGVILHYLFYFCVFLYLLL